MVATARTIAISLSLALSISLLGSGCVNTFVTQHPNIILNAAANPDNEAWRLNGLGGSALLVHGRALFLESWPPGQQITNLGISNYFQSVPLERSQQERYAVLAFYSAKVKRPGSLMDLIPAYQIKYVTKLAPNRLMHLESINWADERFINLCDYCWTPVAEIINVPSGVDIIELSLVQTAKGLGSEGDASNPFTKDNGVADDRGHKNFLTDIELRFFDSLQDAQRYKNIYINKHKPKKEIPILIEWGWPIFAVPTELINRYP